MNIATAANLIDSPKATIDAKVDASDTARFIALAMIIAAALLGAAVSANNGRLHWQGLQWLAGAVLALAGGLILCRSQIARLASGRMINFALLLVVASQIIHLAVGGVITGASNYPKLHLLVWLLLFTLGLFVALVGRRGVFGVALMIGCFASAGWGVIRTDPGKSIDVLEFQIESSKALLAGENPYRARYRNIYHPSDEFYGPGVAVNGWLTYSFPYPPLSVILVAPAVHAGDARYAHLAAISIAAILLIVAGRGSMTAILAAALMLTSPRALYVVQSGWTEPLLIMLAAMVVFCALRWRNGLWLALGLFLSLKQYLIVLLPLLPLLRGSMASTAGWFVSVALAFVLAIATTAPFYYADPDAFLRGVVEWQLVQPFRYDALSFPAMAGQITGEPATAAGGFIVAALAIALAIWKAPRNVGGFMAAAAVVFCCFFALNKQAFCNYYLFVIGLCACAIVGLAAQVRLNSTPPKLSTTNSAR